MMKKSRLSLLFLILCLGLTACGSSTAGQTATPQDVEETDASPSDSFSTAGSGRVIDSDGFTVTSDYVKTQTEEVNVRMKPDEESEIYITLDAGVDLNRTGYRDGWTRVKLNGSEFYVLSEQVRTTQVQWVTVEEKEEVSHVVFLDPAKQMTSNLDTEPVGPDAEEEKAKVAASYVGVSSGRYEYEVTLAVAEALSAELRSRGYTVYMSRETNEVNISNSERAKLANGKEAEIYIRLQAGYSSDQDSSGVFGFITARDNPYSGDTYQQSYDLCSSILNAASEGTGSTLRGISETADMTVLNWCDMPAAVIGLGFLSNETEDEALIAEDYQKKLARNIANGIDLYFEGETEE
jgi:N-acetylmuramoyl-L-alanine amidase